jgi:lysophospholipase L1-like esterase
MNETVYGERFPEDVRWTGRLQSILGDNWTIIEEGLCGRTTVFDDPLREGLNGLKYLVPCLASHNPIDYMIIMLGSNDCKARFSALPKNIADGLECLIVKAKQQNVWRNEPKILIIAPPPIEEGSDIYPIGRDMGPCSKKSEMLAEEYKLWAEAEGCDFLDASSVARMNQYDYMHMDEESHKKLAEKVAEILLEKFI